MKKLVPPCTYQGGKQRYSKQIVDIIFEQNEVKSDTKFYDLCCGSGSITLELISRGINSKNIIMVDKSMWGEFWKNIGNESFDIDKFKKYIDDVPEDKFLIQSYIKDLANQNTGNDKVYKYILLQACSFGGKQVDVKNNKWLHHGFRNYWQPTETSIRKSPVNPMQPGKEELFKRVKMIIDRCKGLTCIKEDINKIDFEFNNKDIIYIDPPYMNTTGYNHNINILEFVNKCKGKIYISEKRQLNPNSICLTLKGSKGGITAKKKKRDEEWLNIFS
ncbi:hypothetical protein ACV3UV_12135 [Clostridium perfringens]